MKSTIIFTIFALLLLAPLASAAVTIEGQTLPGREVTISVWSETGSTQYQAPKKVNADIYGDYEYTYEDDRAPYEVLVIVKNLLNVQEYKEVFGPYDQISGTLELPNLLPDDYVDPRTLEDETDDPDEETDDPPEEPVEPQNETDEQDTNGTDENNQSNITGQAIDGAIDGNIVKIFYYVLGAIFIIGVVAAIVVFIMMKIKNGPAKPAQYGMAPVKLDTKYKSSGDDKYLSKIENEIENVEKQIEMYKKRSRLEDAEKRLEEKKKMLERLKRGQK